jgi:hypothetical protein
LSESENGDKTRDFQPVSDPAEAKKMLKEAARTQASAMIWSKEQRIVVNSHIAIFDELDKIIYAWIPKTLDPMKFMDDLAKIGSAECFFSVSLNRANIFFKSNYLGHDRGGLRFRPPDMIYKVQRRKDLRFTIPDTISLKVEVLDPLYPEARFTKRVLDISASGLAFITAPEYAPMFQVGLTIGEISFTIRGRKIQVPAEVRHTKVMPEGSRYPGVKVGVLFKGIGAGDSQWIASYVFEESRKYLSRFL